MKRRRVRKKEEQEKEEGEEEEVEEGEGRFRLFCHNSDLWLQSRFHLPKTKPWVPMYQVLPCCCGHT